MADDCFGVDCVFVFAAGGVGWVGLDGEKWVRGLTLEPFLFGVLREREMVFCVLCVFGARAN